MYSLSKHSSFPWRPLLKPNQTCLLGDEILEWNGRLLTNKTYDEVHDVIAESRHDPQVELRVCRYVGGGAGSGSGLLTNPSDLGRQPHLSDPLSGRYSSGRGPLSRTSAAPGRPSVTISDPLGDTHMLNPHSTGLSSASSSATRIQVGALCLIFTLT